MNSVILLVDDNAIQATTRQAILERAGSQVITALGGQAAYDYLTSRDTARRVDLIITDHLMPGMNGPELVQKIRQCGFRMPILVVSGHPDAELGYQGLNVIFRMKPCPPDSLIALVHQLLCDPVCNPMPRTA